MLCSRQLQACRSPVWPPAARVGRAAGLAGGWAFLPTCARRCKAHAVQQQQQHQEGAPSTSGDDERVAWQSLAGSLAFGALVGGVLGVGVDESLEVAGPLVQRASATLGWSYFASWTLSFWPQVLQNARRRSAEGLSVDYIVLSIIGYVCYSAYTAALYFSPDVRSAYMAAHAGAASDVQLSDVLFAGHALLVSLLTLWQCWAYAAPQEQAGAGSSNSKARPRQQQQPAASAASSRLSPAGQALVVGVGAAVASQLPQVRKAWCVADPMPAVTAASTAAAAVAADAADVLDGAAATAITDPAAAADVITTAAAAAATAATAAAAAAAGADPTSAVAAAAAAAAGGIAVASPVLVECLGSGASWLPLLYMLGGIKVVMTLIKYTPQAFLNAQRRSTEGWQISNVLLDLSGGLLSLAQVGVDAAARADLSVVTGNPAKLGIGAISIAFDLLFIVQHYVLYPPEAAGSSSGSGSSGAPVAAPVVVRAGSATGSGGTQQRGRGLRTASVRARAVRASSRSSSVGRGSGASTPGPVSPRRP